MLRAALRHRNQSLVRVSVVVEKRAGECRRKQEYIDGLEELLPHCAVREACQVFLLPLGKTAEGASDEVSGPCAQLCPCLFLVLRWDQAEDYGSQQEEIRVEQLLETKAFRPSQFYGRASPFARAYGRFEYGFRLLGHRYGGVFQHIADAELAQRL